MSNSRYGVCRPGVGLLLAGISCLGMLFPAVAGENSVRTTRTMRDSVGINYRQSKIAIDTTYMDNAASLRRIRERLAQIAASDTLYSLTGVEVVGAASPEGSLEFNKWLSENRARKIFALLGKETELPASLTGFSFKGRDWGGLSRMARKDEALPYREETLELLDRIASETAEGEKPGRGYLAKLKKLRGGVPYRYLYRNIFPRLREGHVILSYEAPVVEVVEEEQKVVSSLPVAPDTVYVTVRDTVYIEYCPPCRPFYMNLRTNGLYDLAAIPNLGIEFYLGKGWSIGANWNYAWWSSNRRHRYWRAYGGDINLRKWFGNAAKEKPLTGHHLGIYGQVLTYDFEFGGKGHMGGIPGGTLWDRCIWGGGVEYGYSLPIARRLNLDFSIGIGALTGKVVEYEPKSNGNYVWTSTKKNLWVGPTKAEISLVWQLGCSNVNPPKTKKKKGGVK